MLDAMRKQASSWMVRILLLFLILSFAIWGIGDLFLGAGHGSAVAEVDGLEISRAELDRQLDSDIRQLQASFNNSIDRQQALALGVLNQSLQTLVARRLVDKHAQDLGIGVADNTVGRQIRENTAFRNDAGFDRARFDLFLRSNAMTEDEFIASVRQNISRDLLLAAVAGPVDAPGELGDRLQTFRNEQRTAEVLTVLDEAQAIDDPSEEELAAYLEENAEQFRAPEYRSLVLVSLEPEDIASEIAIADEDVRAEYDFTVAEYTTEERRELAQLLSSDKAVIDEADRLAAEGMSFADILAQMDDTDISFSTIGPVVKNDLPLELADAAWAIDEGEVAQPVKSPFGWHLLKIVTVEPEVVQPYEEVAPDIHDRLAAARALEELPALANALDDEIAAGASLEDAAADLDLNLETIAAVDARGRDKEDNPLASGRLNEQALAEIFLAEPEQTSLLEETDTGGYYMFRVDSIEASRPRELDEVRENLMRLVRSEKQREAARTQAEAILQQANEGRAFASLAEDLGSSGELRDVGPIQRSANAAQAGLSAIAIEKIFATDENTVADEVVDLPGGVALIRVMDILEPESEVAADELNDELAIQIQTDLLSQYEAELRRRYVIELNQAVLSDMVAFYQGEQ